MTACWMSSPLAIFVLAATFRSTFNGERASRSPRLHSTDAISDAECAKAAGFKVSGHLEFGRDVTLPDEQSGRTKTTLALMPDAHWPRLSFFLCQQHRPELIYVPEWLDHPNTAYGVCGMTILADDQEHEALIDKFEGIYGSAMMLEGGFQVATANGPIRVQSRQIVENEFGALPAAVMAGNEPGIIALDVRYKSTEKLRRWIASSGLDHMEIGETITLTNASDAGNTFLRFCKS